MLGIINEGINSPTIKGNVDIEDYEKERKISKTLTPFGMIDQMWNPNWFNFTKTEKGSIAFILNRWMASQLPKQSAMLSRSGIPSSFVSEMWKVILTRLYKRKPTWFYNVTGAKLKQTKKKKAKNILKDFDDDIITKYKELNKLDKFSFKELEDFFPEELLKELSEFAESFQITKLK